MTAQAAFDELANQLEPAGIKKSNMFGMPVLKLGKKPIAGLEPDGINFKLKEGSVANRAALRLEGSHLFKPSLPNRTAPTMKNWVVVPVQHQEKYLDLAQESIKVVEAELGHH